MARSAITLLFHTPGVGDFEGATGGGVWVAAGGCPKCGAEMKIISFIERDQSEVIEKILRHCGLWEEAPARDPPSVPEQVMG